MFLPLLILSLIFIGIGFLVTPNNAPYILAGYNSLSKEEQEKVDFKALVAYFRKFHIFLGTSLFFIGMALDYLVSETASTIFMVSYMFLAYIWFMWKAMQFSPSLNKTGNYIGMILMAGILLFILKDFRKDGQPTELLIKENHLEYVGGYSYEIPWEEIHSIELVDSLPMIKKKKRGTNLGKTNKGIFVTQEGEEVRLILVPSESPFILITTQSGNKIYSSSQSQSNPELFLELKEKLPSDFFK